MNPLKRLFRLAVATPGMIPRLLRGSDAGVVFMLHRFADPEFPGRPGHDTETLRRMFTYLRRRRFELVPLTTLFERAERREPLNGAIAFTIDDGYLDHASVGAPIFAEFDCPVTTFLTTGFLDGEVWFWWDKIEFVLRSTQRNAIELSVGGAVEGLTWQTDAERDAAQARVVAACKRIPDTEKHEAIRRLAAAADVELPARAPAMYAPMSWSDAKRCEASGMTFGPHTVTHPILSRTSDDQSRFEIEESWTRLSSQVNRPVPVFCYPNGEREHDFGDREAKTLAGAGLTGAVVGGFGYATGATIRERHDRFFIPRFPIPDNHVDLVQYVSGLERVKARIRSLRR
jgi:peptidoglycan/xylan/chitin deacetylase (PgdA/CDA1 family)